MATRIKTNHFNLWFLLSFLCFQFFVNRASAQHDSLVLKNGNVIVGEIKSLDRGVLMIETDYSKNDFGIEWSGVKEIYTSSTFLITLSDGRRFNGFVRTSADQAKVILTDASGQKTEVLHDEIVYLKGLKSSFWSRLSGNIDVGLSFTKANNLSQLNVNTYLDYLTDNWDLDGYLSMVRSSQDSAATIKRTDGGVGYKYFLPSDWYAAAALSFLSNTEQALGLRSLAQLGAGKFFIHTNKSYWAVGAGLSFNNERFSNETPDRNSLEAYAGTQLNLFDIGDLNLTSSLYVYPSLTESGRWRTDFMFDTKYDLPLDFYVRAGITINYDNKPAVEGKETDYVLGFGFGWEL